ncbi:MAG TPA: exodeoxyribonuclease V subunit alpha, partial [Desulfobacteraceae bacterium]|nr:exodeoxyribonuclease V subunit alpha [Desulfobacteraceae bacterium]
MNKSNENYTPFSDSLGTYDAFSEIDNHFARLVTRLSGTESPDLFYAAALLSHVSAQGHICLKLSSKWRDKLISSRVVGRPGEFRPLILDEKLRLYLYRYWQYEKILADDIKARSASEIENIDLTLLREGLSRTFEPLQEKNTDWQKLASFISVVKKFCVISGGPGTGKTRLVAKILGLLLEQDKSSGLRIALCAPTGKASVRLQESIKISKETLPFENRIKDSMPSEASTIHRLLGTISGSPYFRHNAANRLPVDVVVLDEASMVDLALMSKLFQATSSDARLILLGDRDQLASVEAGSVLGDICDTGRIHSFSESLSAKYQEITGNSVELSEKYKTGPEIRDCVVELKKNYRFREGSGIGELSSALKTGDSLRALSLLKSGAFQDIKWNILPHPSRLKGRIREVVLNGYKPFLETKSPAEAFYLFGRFQLLSALRKGPYGVYALNSTVEQILSDENLIDIRKRWYCSRPILIKKNDYYMHLFNGDVGIILPDPASDDELRAFFQFSDGTLRSFLPARLPEHETVYAMTAHQSQGSEFEDVLLFLPDRDSPLLTRELVYTAVTRAKEKAEIWGSESVFEMAVSRRIER